MFQDLWGLFKGRSGPGLSFEVENLEFWGLLVRSVMREDDKGFFKKNALEFFCADKRIGFGERDFGGDDLRSFY